MRNQRVTVIIPALDEEETIGRTLLSVLTQTHAITEIIVIDDGSTDKTGVIARSLGATVIRNERDGNNSKARALNQALALTKTELFVSVDADTKLAPNAVEQCLAVLNDPLVGCAAGQVVPYRIRTLWERGRFLEYMFAFSVIKPAQAAAEIVLIAPGCFTVHRTALVQKIGGFRQMTMAEDMDYTWRLIEAGFKTAYVPTALCYPVEPPTFTIFTRQIDRWYRGFLQNIKIRGFKLRCVDVRFSWFVWYYLVWAGLSPILVPFLLWGFLGSLWKTLVGALVMQAILGWLPALYQAKRVGKLWVGVESIPATLVVQYVSVFVFLRAIWRELLIGNTLTHWHKGH